MNRRRLGAALVAFTLALVAQPLAAHVGSADVFLDGVAGSYHVYVTVRPPVVIPGIAQVEVLAADSDVDEIRIVPVPIDGEAARFAPAPDVMLRAPDNPRRFTGQLWMMAAGSWQVRVTVGGARGPGVLAVPVPTLPQATRGMTAGLGAGLFALMVLLVAGIVAIVATIAREASLPAGEAVDAVRRRRGRRAGAIAALVVTVLVVLGHWWWNVEASNYARYVYKPLDSSASVDAAGRLTVSLRDPGWIMVNRLDDFIEDHGHLMHLFIVTPALDRLWHLHPNRRTGGEFVRELPELASGTYEYFADVVHESGIAETATGGFETAGVHGAALEGDDSAWAAGDQSAIGVDTGAGGSSSRLSDGGRIVWVRGPAPLTTRQLTLFTFRVDDAAGRPASDLELYMGMPGHAIFMKRDRTVFAHVHPSGSAPMAAIEISQRSLAGGAPTAAMDAMHHRPGVPATVTFPYGFPQPGDYRIFVQIKRAGRIETGAFDTHVD